MARDDKGINLNIHGARGLFSCMVFIYHVHHSGLPSFGGAAGTLQDLILPSFRYGVELFFGISGIVIVGALPRARSMAAFAWDRITRIFPVLWVSLVAITAMLLLSGGVGRHKVPSITSWLANFVAPPPFLNVPLVHPAAWSLGYEFTFYAIAGAAYYLSKRGFRVAIPVAVTIGVVLLLLYPRGMLMASGVLIATGVGSTGRIARLARYPLANLLIFFLLWRGLDMALDNNLLHLSLLFIPWSQWLPLLPFEVLAWVFGSLALLGISQGHGPLSRLLRVPTMQWLGTISYSLYMWHPIVLAAVKQVLLRLGLVGELGPWTQLAFGAIAIGPTLIVSHYSQILLEKRLTTRLRRYGPAGHNKLAPAASTVSN